MNPIAFIAFLVGISGAPATTPTRPVEQQKAVTVAKPTTAQPCTPKGGMGERGGWDRN